MINKNSKDQESQNKTVGQSGAERYITDMKELPNVSEENEDADKNLRAETPNKVVDDGQKELEDLKMAKLDETKVQEKKAAVNEEKKMTKPTSVPDNSSMQDNPEDVNPPNDEEENSGGKLQDMPFSVKDLILGAINLITVILLIVLLFRIPQKADEVKTLRNDNIKSQTKVELQSAELEKSTQKADQLKSLFLDESGVVNFVADVDKLKAGGVLTEITFQSQQPIIDKTGNSGIPVSIKLAGSWSQIEPNLIQIQALPFMFRPVSIDATADNQGVLIFKYGGLLYVDKSLGKAR